MKEPMNQSRREFLASAIGAAIVGPKIPQIPVTTKRLLVATGTCGRLFAEYSSLPSNPITVITSWKFEGFDTTGAS